MGNFYLDKIKGFFEMKCVVMKCTLREEKLNKQLWQPTFRIIYKKWWWRHYKDYFHDGEMFFKGDKRLGEALSSLRNEYPQLRKPLKLVDFDLMEKRRKG